MKDLLTRGRQGRLLLFACGVRGPRVRGARGQGVDRERDHGVPAAQDDQLYQLALIERHACGVEQAVRTPGISSPASQP
jgi:hypothetical protein